LSSCTVFDNKRHVEDSVFDPRLSNVLQKALEEIARIQKADSISVSLYISNRCHWEGATGITRPKPSVPVESDMIFSFGSITKTFVAAIILQLVEENRLKLDDPLGKWLAKHPNIDTNITIRQLLNHGSGLYDYLNDGESFGLDMEADPNRMWLPEELLEYLGPPPDQLVNVPGYSNTNYILLGMIIEATTGSSLEQELQNRIIGPLHLNSTYLPKKNFIPERWADSRSLSSSLYSGAWASGAIASTPGDIAKWSHALYSGNFLQTTSMESMLMAEDRRSGQGWISMGLGVMKLSAGAQLAWGHTGWINSSYSKTFYIPKYQLSVAYVFSEPDFSTKDFADTDLILAYLNNRPENISKCFFS
jgi:D-alanyl-D-alanine carboxypeptidase